LWVLSRAAFNAIESPTRNPATMLAVPAVYDQPQSLTVTVTCDNQKGKICWKTCYNHPDSTLHCAR